MSNQRHFNQSTWPKRPLCKVGYIWYAQSLGDWLYFRVCVIGCHTENFVITFKFPYLTLVPTLGMENETFWITYYNARSPTVATNLTHCEMSLNVKKMTVVWDVRPDDGGSEHLWNFGKFLPNYTAQHPRRQSSSYSPPWEPEVSPKLRNLLWFKMSRPTGRGTLIWGCKDL
jgi:hypothetical protein